MRHVRSNTFAPDPRDLEGAQSFILAKRQNKLEGNRLSFWQVDAQAWVYYHSMDDLALVIEVVLLVVVGPQRRRFLITAALTAIVAWGRALHARQGLVVCFRRSLFIPD